MARMEMQGFALAALAVTLGGCSGSFQFSSKTAAEGGTAQGCIPSHGPFRVSALDWDEPSRQRFEERVRAGVIVVRAEGCGWTVINGCSVAAKYAYRPQPLRRERHHAGTEMGMGMSSGPGVARSSGGVHDVAIAGAYDIGSLPGTTELEGNCGGATHVVARYSAGAFQIEGGQSKSAGAGAYGAYAGSSNWSQSARQAGKLEACETRNANGDAPPVDCSALVDFDVVPLAAPVVSQAPAPAAATAATASPVDACASGDLAACDLQCRSGSSAACATLTSRCAAGVLPACMAAGSSSLERWLYAGK